MSTRVKLALTAPLTAFVTALMAATLSLPASTASASAWVPPNDFVATNPRGTTAEKMVVQNRVVNMINYTPKGQFIRLAVWNLESSRVVDALLAAHRRGVTVRILMDRDNVTANPSWSRLRNGLSLGNSRRAPAKRSAAKTCEATCRGGAGSMHLKVFLFSKVNSRPYTVMHGAANLTQAIVYRQWTDMVTFSGHKAPYAWWVARFNELWKDTRALTPYMTMQWTDTVQAITPFAGRYATGQEFPVLRYLKLTKCAGVTSGAGSGGRTVIRVGIATMRQELGDAIATRLKQLWDQGCDVRIIYASFGGNTYKILHGLDGRGPVPIRHIVNDVDRDGLFDQYLHTKYVSISGRVGQKRNMNMVIMGSPNWSRLSLLSDESMAFFFRRSAVDFYNRFTDRLFDNPPPNNRVVPGGRVGPNFDPYAKIRAELEED